jgi:hypothetical protein
MDELALALLMTRVLALHAQDALALDHAAIFAKLFNGCSNSHDGLINGFGARRVTTGGEPTPLP